jgi:hypothetical protein
MTRLARLLLAAAALACLSAGSAGGSIAVASAAWVPATTVQPGSSRFGIAAGGGLHTLRRRDLARYLDGVRAARAGWIRLDINWDVIQRHGARRYDWARFDTVVAAARRRGLAVLGVIAYTPPWARPAGTTAMYPPAHVESYARFAGVAVRHFSRAGVRAYEIWNEPNVARFWRPAPDVVRYTHMLRRAYAAIKSADPGATVVSGGLAPHGRYGQNDRETINPLSFLEWMYANGAKGSLDAVGWHPYAFPHDLTFAVWSAWSQMAATTPSALSIMGAFGDGRRKLWATEFGAPTGVTGFAVSEAAQAQLVTDAFAALCAAPWAGPAFLYSYRDDGTDPADVEHSLGIVRRDWSAKPAFHAYRAAATAGC